MIPSHHPELVGQGSTVWSQVVIPEAVGETRLRLEQGRRQARVLPCNVRTGLPALLD